MSKTKKILFKIRQFISIFGLFIGLLFFYLSLLILRYAGWESLSNAQALLDKMKNQTKPTIQEIKRIFGKAKGEYFGNSSKYEVEATWGSKKELIEKFNKYPSMLFYTIGDIDYFIFFDEKGEMIDFIVDHT